MFQLYELLFAIFIFIVIGVLLGFKFAIHIHNPILYILFWVMYFITFLCICSLLGSVYFFDLIRKKTGPKGLKGEKGESGEMGEVGICDPNCRDDMCYKELLKFCENYLNKTHPSDYKPIQITNKYWKDRITMICRSKEFTNLVVLKGRNSVMEYIQNLLKLWLDMLYKEGGRVYFETIGAENEFEWRNNNPWNEIKKYDMYYWGMSPVFRIREFKKCRPKTIEDTEPRIYGIISNDYSLIWGHKRSWGRYNTENSFWKPQQLTKDGKKMYPMGDIFVHQKADNIWKYKHSVRGDMEYDRKYPTGPENYTILVGGDVKSPTGFEHIGENHYRTCNSKICRWLGCPGIICKKRTNYINYYRPIPPKGYICLGDVASTGGPPDKDYYKCIPQDCVERVGGGIGTVFDTDGNSRIYMSKGDIKQSESYNLFFAVRKNKSFNKFETDGMYRIKEQCMKPDDVPPENNPKYSKGWYESQPPKDAKYSVMNFLSLPTEAILVNKGNTRIYIIVRHIKGQKYNSYHVIQHSGGVVEEAYESKLEALTPQNLRWKRNDEGITDTFKWTISNDNKKLGLMTISSEAHNQYLRATSNEDIKLVPHSKADNYCYWTVR